MKPPVASLGGQGVLCEPCNLHVYTGTVEAAERFAADHHVEVHR